MVLVLNIIATAAQYSFFKCIIKSVLIINPNNVYFIAYWYLWWMNTWWTRCVKWGRYSKS